MTDPTGAPGGAPGGAPAGPPRIELRGIEKSFRSRKGTVHVLGGVDVGIRANEFLSVIGTSGCGKTTLLRIAASLTPADAGEVRIDGRVVTDPGPERAVVFQHFGLFPWKTVLDNVRFPLLTRGVPAARATEAASDQLARVGLGSFADSYPHQLSGGMQQRVGLARALAMDPAILLMDEPFGAIDAQTREVMQEELMRLWADLRKTVVFITHDLDEAVLLSDRILVLSRGPASTVRTIVDVDLPRPRWKYDVRAHPNFASTRREIWQLLRREMRDGGDPPRATGQDR